MIKAIKYSSTGEELGKINLPKKLFAVETKDSKALLYEVIKMHLANQRQGNACVQSRSEAHGSGRKLFRQKGTGNARPGNLRTALRVGGGRAFGPKSKNWYKKIPKKKKRLALKLALSERAKENQVVILESLNFDKPNTKLAKELISKIAPEKSKNLLLIDGNNHAIIKSFSNLQNVKMDKADSIFAYEILKCNNLIITEDALKKIVEVFAK